MRNVGVRQGCVRIVFVESPFQGDWLLDSLPLHVSSTVHICVFAFVCVCVCVCVCLCLCGDIGVCIHECGCTLQCVFVSECAMRARLIE